MHFLAFFILTICLISATGDLRVELDTPGGISSNTSKPKLSEQESSTTLAGDPAPFTGELSSPEPDVVMCLFRNHYRTFSADGVSYMASKKYPDYVQLDDEGENIVPRTYTWLEARAECRKRCMDVVSLETPEKFNRISAMLVAYKIPAIWTSGHLCDVIGCDKKPDLQPLFRKGWFWATEINKFLPAVDTVPLGFGFNPWSRTGLLNKPQPDQAELQFSGIRESCIALAKNFGNDGARFHDSVCSHKMQFMCQESPVLVKYVEQKYNVTLSRLPIIKVVRS